MIGQLYYLPEQDGEEIYQRIKDMGVVKPQIENE